MSFFISSSSGFASGGVYSYSGSYVTSQNQPFVVRFEDKPFFTKTIALFWRHILWPFCVVTPLSMVFTLVGNAILARSHNPHLTYADIALACTLGGILIILLRCIFQLLLHTLRLIAANPGKMFSHFSPNAPDLFILLAYAVLPSTTLASTGTTFLFALDASGHQTAREEVHAIDVLHAFEAALIGSAMFVGAISALLVIADLLFQPRALLDSLWVFAVGPGEWRLFTPAARSRSGGRGNNSKTDTSGVVGNNLTSGPVAATVIPSQSACVSTQSDLLAEDGEGAAYHAIGVPPPAYVTVEKANVARKAGDII